MPNEDNNFLFDQPPDFDPEELRLQYAKMHEKLVGADDAPVTNLEILQFARIINFNFMSLTRTLQAILIKTAEMDSTLMNVELNTNRIGNRLHQFFEVNSILDEVVDDGSMDVSGSAANISRFII